MNLIVTAAPPGFRPIHLKAAVDAGKHVFMEKPVAVDPVGVRSVIASSDLAKQKNLAIVAGTQRRHQKRYVEMMKRVQDGQIGEIVAAQCYWNMGDLWVKERTAGMTEMEWQCRNWLYFTWLSGDHIVEQHVHNIDVVNWAMGTMPKNVMGMGGRQVRVGPAVRQHLRPLRRGVRVPERRARREHVPADQGRAERVEERIVGTKGVAWSIGKITGEKPWTFEGEETNPYVQEHIDLIASIRDRHAAQRGTADRREHDVRDHRPHERLHRPRDVVGLGDELVEARPVAREVRVRPEPGGPPAGTLPCPAPRRTRLTRRECTPNSRPLTRRRL